MDRDIAREHFKTQWNKAVFSPKDVQFVVYSKEIWEFAKKILVNCKIVIDLGAGGGTLLYNVKRITTANLIAVDFSHEALPYLKAMVPEAKIVINNITETSFKDERIDFCFSTMTIEHVDDNKFIQEVYRIMKPGGYFFVTTVLKKKWAYFFYKNKDGIMVLEPSHLREYGSLKEFVEKLTTYGFKVLKLDTPRIKFPLIDPLLKSIFKIIKSELLNSLFSTKPIEYLRKITRFPIPGYYAIEVIVQKNNTPNVTVIN